MTTIASLEYISAQTLRGWQRAGKTNFGDKFVVVDVRDFDYAGGHIKGSWHYEAGQISASSPEILAKLGKQDITTAVFTCALSQQRGPASALKFNRYLDSVIADADSSKELVDFASSVRVCVLQNGMAGWMQLYSDDADATEGYDKQAWE